MELLTNLGARAERRMTPRLHIALAGAGALIAVGGAIGLGGDNLVDDDGDVHRITGVLVTALLVAAGIAVLTRIRTGAYALAASTAVAIGVPVLVFFLTVNDDGFPPFSFDAVLGVSALAWLALYVVGPARGRMVLLAGALAFAPIFVMEEVENISSVPETIGQSFSRMFTGTSSESFDSSSGGSFDSGGGTFDPDTGEFTIDEDFDESDSGDFTNELEEVDLPDPTNLGLIALVFGIAYLAGAHLLTRRGLAGTGTPLAVVGALSSFVAITFLADDLEEIGSGLFLVALGVALLFVGAAAARRFTTWFGGFAFAVGVIVLVAKMLGDSPDGTAASLVFLLVGLAVVFLAQLLADRTDEPDEEDALVSFPPRTLSTTDDDVPPPAAAPDGAFAPDPPVE
jgi:hypothetical protein